MRYILARPPSSKDLNVQSQISAEFVVVDQWTKSAFAELHVQRREEDRVGLVIELLPQKIVPIEYNNDGRLT